MTTRNIWIKNAILYPAVKDGKHGVQCDVIFCDDQSLIGREKESRSWAFTADEAMSQAIGAVCHLWSCHSVLIINAPEWTAKYHSGELFRLRKPEKGHDLWIEDAFLIRETM